MNKCKIKIAFLRIISILLVASVPEQAFAYTIIDVAVERKQHEQELINYYETDKLKYYLEREKENSVGLFVANREELLNDAGLFDTELMDLSEDEVEFINEAKSVEVSTQYIEYELEENVVSEENTEKLYREKVMDKQEIDNLIDELYIKDQYPNTEKNKVINKFMEGIGLKPMTAYAAYRSQSDTNSTTYLKKSLIVSQSNDLVHVIFVCTWLTPPSNRLLDIVTVTYGGACSYKESNNYSATLTYTETVRTYVPFNSKTTSKTVSIDCTKDIEWLANGKIAVPFELPDNIYTQYVTYDYTNIKFKLSFWLERDGKKIEVIADYAHQKKKVSVSLLNGAALTVETIAFIASGGSSLVVNCLTGVGAVINGINLFETEEYYSSAGGSACNVAFYYK